MIRSFNPYLVLFAGLGLLLAFGCQSVEQDSENASQDLPRILPARGLPDVAAVKAGPVSDEKSVSNCKAYEKMRAIERKWPAIVISQQPIHLRSHQMNAQAEDLEGFVLKYNMNLGNNRTDGCFVNALEIKQDNTVIDYATGLMWKSKPSKAKSRSEADEYIRKLNQKKYAGYDDWRIPTTEEISSIVDSYGYDGSSYVDPYYFGRLGSNYMTADTYKYEGVDMLWIVNARARSVQMGFRTDSRAHVQAVRSL